MRTHRAGVRTAEARRGGCAVGKHSSSHITPHAGRIPHRPPAAAAVRPRSKPAHRSFTSDHMTLQDRSQSLLDEHAPRASVLSQATCRFTLAARLGGLDPILHSANVVSCIAQSLLMLSSSSCAGKGKRKTNESLQLFVAGAKGEPSAREKRQSTCCRARRLRLSAACYSSVGRGTKTCSCTCSPS